MSGEPMAPVLLFARRHARLVVLSTIGAALVGAWLVSRVSFDANILRLLPQRSRSVASFQTFLRDFGSLDHLYVLFEAADGIGEHTGLVDAYVAALRRAPDIESVDTQLFEPGKDWSYLSDRVLYLLGPDGARAALDRFSPDGVERELLHARDLLSMPAPQVKAIVQEDPLGLLALTRDRLGRRNGLIAADPTQEGYVSADGRSRLVIVKPKGAPFDADFCKELFRRLSSVESEARHRVGASDPEAATVTIQVAGAYRVALEAEDLIRREGVVNAIGSLALLLIMVFALFRTPWIMLYGSIPLALAALLTLGVNGAARGSLTPATSGSAGMLFGLGIDGIVVLYMRYLEQRRPDSSPECAIRRMAGTASSVGLAQMTTAATFLALLFVDFPTLQELGALVGVGILICCGFTLVLLPALLGRGIGCQTGRPLASAWLGRFVSRAATPLVWGGVVATVALGAAAVRLRLDPGIEKLQARTSATDLEEKIAARFSLPRDVLLAVGESQHLEPLIEAGERLTRSLDARMPSRIVDTGIGLLLPSARSQSAVAEMLSKSRITPASAREAIETAAARIGFRPGSFSPFLDRLPRLLDPALRVTYEGLAASGIGSILSRFVARRDGRFETVTYLYPRGSVDFDALGRLTRASDPALQLTGLPIINHELRSRLLFQFAKGIAIGTIVVAILIYAVFRSLRLTLLALAPTAVGFVWSAGVLALARVELDLFSLFAAVTFIGIAVDYGIYVLYRYAIEGHEAMPEVLARIGAPIMIACATALVGYGTLVHSSYGPLRVFGIVSIVTLACCLVTSIVFLPAFVIHSERWSSSAR